jgi:hypothetical protein
MLYFQVKVLSIVRDSKGKHRETQACELADKILALWSNEDLE